MASQLDIETEKRKIKRLTALMAEVRRREAAGGFPGGVVPTGYIPGFSGTTVSALISSIATSMAVSQAAIATLQGQIKNFS